VSRLQQLQAFLAQDPNDSFTRYAIGLEYAKAQDYTAAIRTLEELRTIDADYVPTYLMLGGYYREVNDTANAEAIYKEGLLRARKSSDLHAASELQAALDELDDQ